MNVGRQKGSFVIDRAIGLIGIALALLTGAVGHFFPAAPGWLANIGYGFGVLLIGVSFGLIAAGGLRRKRKIRDSAYLKLHVYGDHRTPDCLSYDNIFRWYYLQMGNYGVDLQGQSRQWIAAFSMLLVTFEDDVKIHTLRVNSPDMQIPVYEVKEFNQRYAIIVFAGAVPAGTLEVIVSCN